MYVVILLRRSDLGRQMIRLRFYRSVVNNAHLLNKLSWGVTKYRNPPKSPGKEGKTHHNPPVTDKELLQSIESMKNFEKMVSSKGLC